MTLEPPTLPLAPCARLGFDTVVRYAFEYVDAHLSPPRQTLHAGRNVRQEPGLLVDSCGHGALTHSRLEHVVWDIKTFYCIYTRIETRSIHWEDRRIEFSPLE
jgi:hypothetical protein